MANPRGDREPVSYETMMLRRTFYPRSTGLGRTVEDAAGAGTPEEVRNSLGASVLHLGCGVTPAGALELSGPAELGPDAIAATTVRPGGGLAILPPLPAGPAPLVDALLAAGFTAVVGWQRPVPERVAALMLFLLHARARRRRHGTLGGGPCGAPLDA